jgi:transcriptional regulator with XRE-family HTH domain
MSRRVGEYFRQRRLEKGWTIVQLAEAVGLTSSNKHARRIGAFEESGRTSPDLLARLMAVLGIDRATLRRLAYEDYREWLSNANTPVAPYVVRRMLWGGGPLNVPEYVQSVQGAEHYAALLARYFGMDTCLVLSRRIKVWITKEGEIQEIVETAPGDR